MGDGLKRARDAARATRGLAPEVPKLGEIAERIAAHLARFEADPVANAYVPPDTQPFSSPTARVNGRCVDVFYRWSCRQSMLTKAEALAYLAWLDAGNVGRHFEQQRAVRGGAL